MVRAPRYGYQAPYFSGRRPIWQEGERIDRWNPFYRQDLTGGDEEISLEDVEGGKPPAYVPLIDRQALGYRDLQGPRNPFQQAGFTPEMRQSENIRDLRGQPLGVVPEPIPGWDEINPETYESFLGPGSWARMQEGMDRGALRAAKRNATSVLRAKLKDEPYISAYTPDELMEGKYAPPSRYEQATAGESAARQAREIQDATRGPPAYIGGGPTSGPEVAETIGTYDGADPTWKSPVQNAGGFQPDPNFGKPDLAEQQRRIARDQAAYELEQRGVSGAAGPASPIDAGYNFGRPQQDVQSIADVFSAPLIAPLIAGPSISDRVRGNRYANMDPRERRALNLTIAGELAPSSYGTPGGDQEVANMVETITTRAAQKGKSIEDTVKQDQMYSPWNTLDSRAAMRENFKEHGPDVRRMVANAITGEVMPTHEGLTSYHATRMPGSGRKPDWARGIEPSARAGKHSFYTDIAPWSSSPAGPQLPPAPVGAITSNDLPTPPPPTSLIAGRPESPLGPGSLPPAGPPPPTLQSPFTPESGMPATPEERMGTGTGVSSAPLIRQGLGVPASPAARRGFANEALNIDPATGMPAAPGTRPLIAPAATPAPAPTPVPTPAPAPAPAPAAPVSTMRDVARGARGTGVDYIYRDPGTNILSGFDDKNPWTPEQQAQIAGAVPGIVTDAGGLRLPPPAPAPAPAPAAVPAPAAITPRQEVTPGTPLHPEDTTGLPPAGVPPVTPMTPEARTAEMERRAAAERERLGGTYSPTDAPLITPPASTTSTTTGAPLIANPNATFTTINPRLSPKEIEKRARTRGFGTVENLTGDRWARGIGAGVGAVGGLMVGGLPGAVTFGGMGYRNADDMRRSYMNRSGPFGILGNIFGGGLGRKDKNKDTIGTPPSSEPAGVKEAAAAASRTGLGSDRGNYGYSTGGRDIDEGVGGRYGRR